MVEKIITRLMCDVCPDFQEENYAEFKCYGCGKDLCKSHAAIYTSDTDHRLEIAFCWDCDPHAGEYGRPGARVVRGKGGNPDRVKVYTGMGR